MVKLKFKQVIICEKGNQAKLFVKMLKLTKTKMINGTPAAYYDVEGGICCVYQSGHLLELMPPEYYESGLSRQNRGWNIDDLPILPALNEWKLQVKKASIKRVQDRINALFAGIKWAIKDLGQPDEIILASDNDQEGELLAWEMVIYLGCGDHKNITRMLYSKLTVGAVKKAYDERESGDKWYNRYLSGLSRLYADWLIGMNITMAITTVNTDKIPPKTALNCGRVIFAISYIFYKRHLEIINYKPQDFFTEKVTFDDGKGARFVGNVSYPDKYLDPELKRLTDEAMAAKFSDHIKKAGVGEIVMYEKVPKKKPPPLGFHRTGFDIFMNKKHGLSLDAIADALQKLYGDLALVTYPRVSVKQLDDSMHVEMPGIVSAMAKNLAGAFQLDEKQKKLYARAFQIADMSKKTKIFKKGVDDEESHHAIIPTDAVSDLSKLTPTEFLVYRELADRLIIQFLPDYEYVGTTVETKIGGIICKSSGATPTKKGWKGLSLDIDEEEEAEDTLPPLVLGQKVKHVKGVVSKSTTVEPKLYTEATILADLESPAKFVENKELMKKIKKLQIGTDGTRPAHIKTLVTKGFLDEVPEKVGRKKIVYLKPTRKLIAITTIAPDYFRLPETSAYWEDSFIEIRRGNMTLETFYARQSSLIKRFFVDLKKGGFRLKELTVDKVNKCEAPCGGNTFFKALPAKKFDLWVCGKCEAAYIDKDGEHGTKLGTSSGKGGAPEKWEPPEGTAHRPCPNDKCAKGKVYHKKIEGKDWSLWVCTTCESQYFNSKGEPGNMLEKKKKSRKVNKA